MNRKVIIRPEAENDMEEEQENFLLKDFHTRSFI